MRVAGVLMVLGCSGGATPSATCPGDIALDVGTGVRSYTPLVDGDRLAIVNGTQAGWHVDVSAAVTDSVQEVAVTTTLRVIDVDRLIVNGDQETFYALVDYDDLECTGEVWGITTFIDLTFGYPQICALHTMEADLTVTVSDLEGDKSASDTVRVFLETSQDDLDVCAKM